MKMKKDQKKNKLLNQLKKFSLKKNILYKTKKKKRKATTMKKKKKKRQLTDQKNLPKDKSLLHGKLKR